MKVDGVDVGLCASSLKSLRIGNDSWGSTATQLVQLPLLVGEESGFAFDLADLFEMEALLVEQVVAGQFSQRLELCLAMIPRNEADDGVCTSSNGHWFLIEASPR